MSQNLTIQYILVGVILLGIAAWLVWKIIKIRKNGTKSCCGCTLYGSCSKDKENTNTNTKTDKSCFSHYSSPDSKRKSHYENH